MPGSPEDSRVSIVMREMLATCADRQPPVSADQLHAGQRRSLSARIDTKVVLALAAVVILVVALAATGPLRRTSGSTPAASSHHVGSHVEFSVRPVLCYAPPVDADSSLHPAIHSSVPPLECSAPYALTAAHLNVTPDSGGINGYTVTSDIGPDPDLAGVPSTAPSSDRPTRTVLLPGVSGQASSRYVLGPAGVVGADVRSASAVHQYGQWVVLVELTPAGAKRLDQLAHAQFHAMTAIDLDGVVLSAPLQQPTQTSFSSFGGKLAIAGSFTKAGATEVAHQINQAR